MFYDKKVELWKKGEKIHIGGGVHTDGEPTLVKTMMVDIQPYSKAEAQKDYGYTVDCTNLMYCGVEDIKINTNFIKYNEKPFDIAKIIEWDDYMELLLDEI